MEKIPRIGICVIIRKDNKILLGKRIGSHGSNTWSFPGGKLDFGEKIVDCALRETKEETNLEIKNLFITKNITEDLFQADDKHYITLYVLSDWDSGEPEIMEPNKCVEWKWFDWNNLPEPLFPPVLNLKAQNFNPFN
jgi:8-oxo-dGTP diphosphatase